MRLWTVHPRYLDAQGLVALWREGLLAQKVLQGLTKGYKHHPQLTRFRSTPDPHATIASYLIAVLDEAMRRGYAFNAGKIASTGSSKVIIETRGQLLYEWCHLKRKLASRDAARYKKCHSIRLPTPHPLFRIVAGDVQTWERVK
jgi:hypothetical protein